MVGIPTILITLIPENSRQAGTPRAFHPKDFKLGNCLGGPHQNDLQRKVLLDALHRWEAREEAGTIWEHVYPEYTGQDDSWKKALEEG
jgi:D-proline reductase (dithiol) PrdB